jgi:DNA-binding PadR family transcriptional regulator
MTDDLIKHFFGGFVRLHILYHAEQEPICGVEMIEELARHGYSLSPGTLYPILHQLESGGYLIATKQVVAGRQRKNYRITASGRKLLREARAKLRELGDEVLSERRPSSQSPSKTKRTRK